MDSAFLGKVMAHHRESRAYPPSGHATRFAGQLFSLLFPESQGRCLGSEAEITAEFDALHLDLLRLLLPMQTQLPDTAQTIASQFMEAVPSLFDLLQVDAQATLDGDPAAQSLYEVIRAYPGFHATALYRFAHHLHGLGVPLIPRLITEEAHQRTGIDIHPGASIGAGFCIDHGTGVVIGETTEIGQRVKMYQGVTLGALSVRKSLAQKKRHPTIEDDVVIYAGATILGGETVIGRGSVIGGNVWLTSSVPPESRIYYQQGQF